MRLVGAIVAWAGHVSWAERPWRRSRTSRRRAGPTGSSTSCWWPTGPSDGFITDWAVNISQGGLFINTRNPLAVGTTVRLIIQLPDTAFPFDLTGRVMRVTEFDNPSNQVPGQRGLRCHLGGPTAWPRGVVRVSAIEGVMHDDLALDEELGADRRRTSPISS